MFAVLTSLTLLAAAPSVSDVGETRVSQHSRLSLAFDVGAPEGAGASISFAAFPFLRLQLGVAYNAIAPGMRGGVTLVPFATFVRPTLSLHAGHFEPGDASKVASVFSDNAITRSPLLDQLQYDFVSAHLGVEIGRANGPSFFLRGGFSRATVRLGGFGSFVQTLNESSASTAIPTLTVAAPSVQLGLLFPLL